MRATTLTPNYPAYIGEDHPEYWDLPPVPPVALIMEDPVHYPILGPDAQQEWASNSPPGISFVRMGAEHRAFSVSMLHQLHCLRSLRAALAGDYRPATQGHFAHCLQYIRQMVLCEPNLTLEPSNVLKRNYDEGVKEPGATHVCPDWTQVYDVMDENWKEWMNVREQLRNAGSTPM